MSRLRCLAGHRSSKRGRLSWLERCSSISPRSPFRVLPRSRNRCSRSSYDGLCLDPIALGDASSSRRCNSDVWVTPNSLCFPRVRVGPDVNDSLMFNKPDWGTNWVSVLPVGFDYEVSFGDKVRKLRRGSVGTCGLSRIQSLAPVLLRSVQYSPR